MAETSKELVFEAWAPESARWSKWVKPVLFAHLDCFPPAPWQGATTVDLSWTPSVGEGVALVIDLPGPDGVHVGLDLAGRGYRPVPLYNAIPMPSYQPEPDEITPAVATVDVQPIMSALWHGREFLEQLSLPAEAPPAFLLDWDRSSGGNHQVPGAFDNRSVSFTTDFPSATFLLAHGLRRVVLVQPYLEQPRPDLAHTLRRWQEAGLPIELKRLDLEGPPGSCVVQKPSWFGWAWQRVLMAAGLQRGNYGGFGGWLPDAAAG